MNDIILLAIEEEAPSLAKHPNVFFTGVGKVNAALCAARLIEKHRPRTIWNFGTAGGITVEGGLHRCTRFIQRDMLVTALGFPPGQTPFEDAIAIETGTGGLTCSSGDSFVTDSSLHLPSDLVDMEAYALAKACARAGVAFQCHKFISDRADDSSSTDWTANVRKGETDYVRILKENGLL